MLIEPHDDLIDVDPRHIRQLPLAGRQGVTEPLLFGNDRNRNGVLDPDEDDGSGAMDRGWSAYLTVYSREQNVDSTGAPRIFINDNDLNSLESNLTTAGVDADLAKFIVEYRRYGPYEAEGSSQSGNTQNGNMQGGNAQGGTQNSNQGTSSPVSGTNSSNTSGRTESAPACSTLFRSTCWRRHRVLATNGATSLSPSA